MISIKNLSFSFKKKEPLFQGVTLDLQPGRTYGLFGLNGAGKTTLLNLIAGMLFPKSGECTIYGVPAGRRTPAAMSNLFVVPEQFELPPLDAKTYEKLHAPFYPCFDQNRFREILVEFEVDPGKKLTSLSFGQRKKFLVAFGLAANTPYLLLDEPTNGLDIPSKSRFRKILAAGEPDDRCVILSTHQARDLTSLIDQVTVLKDGHIIFDQSLEAISAALIFKTLPAGSSESRIYGEETLGGEAAVCLRANRETGSDINLELLFNAVTLKTEEIYNAFKQTVEP